MGRKSLFFFIYLFVFATASMAANKRFTLVIDPGHGGHDTGAMGAISKEKDINLTVALAFGQYVERNCPDVKVIYTRKKDIFITLIERANIANRNRADLFISIHTNALPGGKVARGFETYTLGMHRAKDNLDVAMRENSVISMEKDYKQTYQGFNPRSSESYIMFEFIQGKNMERSIELAKLIQSNVCSAANRPDKGVHQAGFLVLRETSMPSCLIELGFITTPDEEQALNNSPQVDNIAKGIYNAFIQYKSKYDDNIVIPYKAEKIKPTDIPTVIPPPYSSVDEPEKKLPKEEKPFKQEGKAAKTEDETVKIPAIQTDSNSLIFKVQILASSCKLKIGDPRLKGIADFNCYEEDCLYKYTCGGATDYYTVLGLRKQLADKFPQAFIVAFKDGKRIDISTALKEYRLNK